MRSRSAAVVEGLDAHRALMAWARRPFLRMSLTQTRLVEEAALIRGRFFCPLVYLFSGFWLSLLYFAVLYRYNYISISLLSSRRSHEQMNKILVVLLYIRVILFGTPGAAYKFDAPPSLGNSLGGAWYRKPDVKASLTTTSFMAQFLGEKSRRCIHC